MENYIIQLRKYLLCCLLIMGATLTSSVYAQTVVTILGKDTVCAGEVVSYTPAVPLDPAYNYSVSVPLGAGTILSASIAGGTIQWQNTGATSITLIGTDGNNTITVIGTQDIYVQAYPAPFITPDIRLDCRPLNIDSVREGNVPPVFDSNACLVACEYSTVVYAANGASSSAYVWTVAGANSVIPNGETCIVTWGAAGAGSVKVREITTGGECEGEQEICVDIVGRPNARFMAMPNYFGDDEILICKNGEVVLVDQSTAGIGSPLVEWHWDWGDGQVSNTSPGALNTPVTHQYTDPGSYEIVLTVTNACGCTSKFTMRVKVLEEDAPKIACTRVACENERITYTLSYTNPEVICDQPTWEVIGGSITAMTPTAVEVRWDNVDPESGFGYVMYTTCGPCPMTVVEEVPVVLRNGKIQGPSSICIGDQYVYRLPKWPTTDVEWSVSSGIATLQPTDQPNEIVLTATAGGTVTLTASYCNTVLKCTGTAKMEILIRPVPVVAGPTARCVGDNATYTVAGGYLGNWTLTDPLNNSTNWANLNSITPNFGIPGIYKLRVEGTAFCRSEEILITVHSIPEPPQFINGPDRACYGVPVEYTAGNDEMGTYFTWSVSGGGTANANNGTVSYITFNGTPPQTVAVRRVIIGLPHCASDATTKVVLGPVPPLTIVGNQDVCHSTTHEYELDYLDGDFYEWSVSPQTLGSVTAGANSTTPEVLWNMPINPPQGETGWLKVKITKCNTVYWDSIQVNVMGSPDFTVTVNDNDVCAGDLVTYTIVPTNPSFPITSATQIIWNTGQGTNTTGFAPTYTFAYANGGNTAPVTYTGSVTIIDPNGCEATVTAVTPGVTVRPAPSAYITPAGSIELCPPATIDLTTSINTGIGGTNNFVWNGPQLPLPPSNTYTWYNVSTPGNYSVTVTNSNGCSSTSNVVTITSGCPVYCAPGNEPTSTGSSGYNSDCGTVSVTAGYIPGAGPWYQGEWAYPVNATNVTLSTGTSASFTGTLAQPGSYVITYKVRYINPLGDTCSLAIPTSVVVPYLARPRHAVACASGSGGYAVTLFDNSVVMPAFYAGLNRTYHYATSMAGPWTTMTAAIGNMSATATLAPGNYVLRQVIWNGSSPACTEYINVNLPALPIASFVLNSGIPNPGCEKDITFNFTNTSTPATGLSYLWDFDDQARNTQQHAGRVFDDAGPYNVTLTVTNEYGCANTAYMTIDVVANDILPFPNDAMTTAAPQGPPAPCIGTPVSLGFTSGAFTPTIFTWHKDAVALATTSSPANTFDVFSPGTYWVLGSNAAGCKVPAASVSVDFTIVPPITISGSATACANAPFGLTATQVPGATYAWTRDGSPTGGSTNQITETLTFPGTYDYEVLVTYNGCPRSSNTLTVTVLPPPAPPVISFSMLNCDPYEIQLDASGPSGIYNWSNGMAGQTIVAGQGGPYQVTYTSPNGCTSQSTVQAPKDLLGYLWLFPDGCFCRSGEGRSEAVDRKCEGTPPYILAHMIWVDYWAWYRDAGVDLDGYYSYVEDYLLPGSGTYNLELNNGYCSVYSKDMFYNLEDTCRNLTMEYQRPAAISTSGVWLKVEGQPGLLVAPNPAQAQATITYKYVQHSNDMAIELYDAAGRRMQVHTLTNQQGILTLQLEGYASGMYQVRMKQNGKTLLNTKLSLIK